ncbi:MAG: hypothetical protein ACHQE5_08440 [Actinomycetes bacterium]
MRSVAAIGAVSAAVLLAGCTGSSPAPSPSPTRSAPRPISLDGGALVVTPVTATTPTVGRDQAARFLANVEMPMYLRLTPVLASVVVSLPPRVVGQQSIGGQVRVPLAWVYLVQQPPGPRDCTGFNYATASPPADASRTWAVIMDATTGVGYVYTGAGAGYCWPGPVPILRQASWTFSILFTTTRLAPLRYRQTFRVPACGKLDGEAGAMAMATVATGPCHGSPTTQVDLTHGRIIEQPHAKIGLLCFSTFDREYGKPLDCAY